MALAETSLLPQPSLGQCRAPEAVSYIFYKKSRFIPEPALFMTALRRKIFGAAEVDEESGQQIGGFINVVESDGFDGAVHIAIGDAD